MLVHGGGNRQFILHAHEGSGTSNMSLWVDKHRPTLLNKLDYHKEQAAWLKKLVSRFLINCMTGPGQ